MPSSLTVTQLFQPAPSGVGPYGTVGGAIVGVVPQLPGQGSWLETMLRVAATVQLPTTSWQPGDPERTIFATESVCFSLSDACISQMAQGGFLLSASSGTVTYVTPSGVQVTVPVTPDPSNAAQNPTGAPGFLDLLSQNVYDVTRLQATYVTGPLAIAKTSPGTIGPYSSGSYHVGSIGGATFHNSAALSIPSSQIAGTGGVITAITSFLGSTILTTQTAHGLTPGQSVYVTIPQASGITGLTNTFAVVTATGSTTQFSIPVGSSGTYSGSGGTVYLCTVAQMIADVVGIGSNVGPGTVTTTVTQNANVFISNVVGWSGSNWESNTALAARCLLSLAARSPNGPSQAYTYFAETAFQILQNQTPPYQLTNGPVRAVTLSKPRTGIVTVVVGSATPQTPITLGSNITPGVSQLGIASIANGNPTTITCVGPTSLSVGQTFTVTISGVLGLLNVNGTFLGTYVTANSFSIPLDSSALPAYTGGGSIEGGDLGQIDRLIQTNCVPDNTLAVTASALALLVQITATVIVPQSFVTTYQNAVSLQLQTQIDSYNIGGNAPDYAVLWTDIVGALEEAGVQVLGQASIATVQSLSLNGLPPGFPVLFPSSYYQAILINPLITVLGI